ncbi:hypothetical protein E1B28_002423 [Marasmius oreades]|uniref:Uncharacterized protein n=1 Tax=Marasmius oreades TaxID=181124 RepID=A0A9P7RN06_9AGAR|nr:uncharacterized protein E1B28_002423 [Marasmius oreades]KAG7086472.1 hypothetical protein E1B28_002423 [Marasmius oreades]
MSPVHNLYPISNHKPQDSASLHGFWAYFGICSVIGIASAGLLYSLYSCYHSAGVRERASIRNSSFEHSEAKERDQRSIRLKGKREARSSGVWSEFYQNRSESSVEAMSPILRQSTSQSPSPRPSTPDLVPTSYVDLSYPGFNSHSPTLSTPPATYDPTRDPSPCNPSSTTDTIQARSDSPSRAHPSTLRPGRTTTFDRNSIPFIAPEQLAHHLIDPKLAPIGGSFSMFANNPDAHSIPVMQDIGIQPVEMISNHTRRATTARPLSKPKRRLTDGNAYSKTQTKQSSPAQRCPLGPININCAPTTVTLDSKNSAFHNTINPFVNHQLGLEGWEYHDAVQ